MNKFFLLLIILTISYGCSYEPMLATKNFDFKFEKIIYQGDPKINDIIKNDLTRKSNGNKIYSINFTTKKYREILSSNEKGDPTKFRLKIETSYFLTQKDEIIFENKILRQVIYNNISDKFELSQYEDNITKNLSHNISSEILMNTVSLTK